jgi:hypothetical protein
VILERFYLMAGNGICHSVVGPNLPPQGVPVYGLAISAAISGLLETAIVLSVAMYPSETPDVQESP